MSYKALRTHSGKSHDDDLLACCLFVHKEGGKIYRVPILEDNDYEFNPCAEETFFVDIGKKHDVSQKQLKYFDHHQDKNKDCSFFLLLDYYGLMTDATILLYAPIDIRDTGGPQAVEAVYFKGDGVNASPFWNAEHPVIKWIHTWFSEQSYIDSKNPYYHILAEIGKQIEDSILSLNNMLWEYKRDIKFHDVICNGVYLNVATHEGESSREKMIMYFDTLPPNQKPDLFIVPDNRNPDQTRMLNRTFKIDFRELKWPEFSFVHATGFLAVARLSVEEMLDRLNEATKDV